MPELIDHDEWRGGSLGRVLVEAAEWGRRATYESALQAAGYATASCPGPEGADRRCTLASGAGCEAAERADVVVHALRTTDLRNLEALRALRRRCPDTSIVVEASPAVVAERSQDLAGCIVVDAPLTDDALIGAVEEALAGRS